MRPPRGVVAVCALLALLGLTQAITIDPIERWTLFVDDEVMPAIDLQPSNDLDSTAAARIFAMLHIAMHDAYNCFISLNPNGALLISAPTNASLVCEISQADPVAASHAAAAMMVQLLFPQVAVNATQLLTDELALLASANTSAQEYGVAVGFDIATAVFVNRSADGFSNATADPWIIYGNRTTGIWRPTPPAFGNFTTAGYARVLPFGVEFFSNSTPSPPPLFSSAEFAIGYNQVKSLGSLLSATRTEAQTNAVIYWGAKNSANRWFDVCLALAEAYNTTFEQNLVLYSLVSMSQIDATLASFAHKAEFLHWRPVSAIQSMNNFVNPDTEPDAAWAPYRPAEATPDYPSTVSSSCSASGKAVFNYARTFLGATDDILDVTLDGRTFGTLSEIIHECGMSRIYQGVHFGFSVQAGSFNGYAVADELFSVKMGLGAPTDLPLPAFLPPPPPSPEPEYPPYNPLVSPLGWVGITILIMVLLIVVIAAVTCCTPLGARCRSRFLRRNQHNDNENLTKDIAL